MLWRMFGVGESLACAAVAIYYGASGSYAAAVAGAILGLGVWLAAFHYPIERRH